MLLKRGIRKHADDHYKTNYTYNVYIGYILCMINLDSQQREFLHDVAAAAFSNPFSEERLRLDKKIAQVSKFKARRELLDRVVTRMDRFVDGLEQQGRVRVDDAPAELRHDLEFALLFHVFHRFLDQLAEFIEEQRCADQTLVPLSFAEDLLAMLEHFGFNGRSAVRAVEMFYQFRRAYYFVDQGLIGTSASMKELRLHLWNNVFTHEVRWYDRYLWNRMEDFSTLILGETGTGKGAAAAAIGRSGYIPFDRKNRTFKESFTRSFVSLNLSQYPEALMESELFGHKRGAFTGAIDDHDGIFSRCSPHGAIFLDEIGEVTTPVQIKLLKILQDRVYTPVGSHEGLPFRGRVIAATNRAMDDLRAEDRFRDDFYYRLCSDVVVVPPLRQRIQEDPSELDDLVPHLVQRLTGEASGELVDFVHAALSKSIPKRYAWPGNVREVEQAVRRIILTGSYDGDYRAVAPNAREALRKAIDTGSLEAEDLVANYCTMLYEQSKNYEEVGRRTGLDRRTVKRYVNLAAAQRDQS